MYTMTSRNLKNFEFRLGRHGILLFVASMSLLLFLIFILGVAVGIHIDAYPEKIARVVPRIIGKQIERSLAKTERTEEEHVAERSHEGKSHSPVVAVKPLAPVAEGAKEIAAAGSSGSPLALPKKLENVSDVTAESKSSPEIAEGKGSKPREAAAGEGGGENRQLSLDLAKKSGEPKAKFEGGFMLRVVSFKSRKKAEQFSEKLTSLGYSPQVTFVNLPKKGRWFRVVVYGFKTEEDAQKVAAALSKEIKGVNCVIAPAK